MERDIAFDGLSIGLAVTEHLAVLNPNIVNYQVTVKEMPDQIIFLHPMQPGGTDKFYGIEAGCLRGYHPQ